MNKSSPDQLIVKSRTFTLVKARVTHPNGRVFERDVVRHPGAVVICPVQADGSLILIRQFRSSLGKFLIELPAGTLEAQEDPLNCAQRELREETGFGARSMIEVATLYPAPGFCDEKQTLFLARDLFADRLPGDEDEDIEVMSWSLARVREAAAAGEIQDGKTLAALFIIEQKRLFCA